MADATRSRHELRPPCFLPSQFDRWVGYEHENFRGRQYLWDMSERGEYNCYDKWCAQGDHVSSVRAVKQVKTATHFHAQTAGQRAVPPLDGCCSLLANSLHSITAKTCPHVCVLQQDNNPARAQLFERAAFSGKKMELQDDIPNLMSRYSLNRAASIRVLGGA